MAVMPRDVCEAAKRVLDMSDEQILVFAKFDPGLFRDVAKGFLALRAPQPQRAAT